MSDELHELTIDEIIAMGGIDLEIEEAIRSLDDCGIDYGDGEIDRTLVITHLRWAYLIGRESGLTTRVGLAAE